MDLVLRATLCHIISGDRLVLKLATRGISKGKWNGPGGKLDPGETPKQCAIREVFEETGLEMRDPFFHGRLRFHMGGSKKLAVLGYLFSTRKFSGKLRSTEEGKVMWFKTNGLPYEKMWDDDKVWMPMMLDGRKFDAHFYYGKGNKKVKRCIIKLRNG
ncbi:MAG: 8-oxo-dGTP diphosphatase [Candidatus Micrarchaeota archaeon]|nr:8-oxo-dGTP diphosphatase [Candidatus Micrarchaeota archaeon]